MSEKVAVIGANGYIGTRLCNTLIEQGSLVLRLSSGGKFGISLETGLFSNEFILPKGIDTVYYLAQSPNYRQTPEFSAHLLSVNCVAAVQAAEASRRVGAKRFIYASTANVYEPSFLPIAENAALRRDNWYSLSKVMAEDALALFQPDLDVTLTRIFAAYGTGQTDKLIPMIANKVINAQDIFLARNPTNPNDEDGLALSPMYIDDMVSALISLRDISDCTSINLAGTETISIRQLAMALGKFFDIPAKISLNDDVRQGNFISETSKQLQLLGRPSVSFLEGLERFCHSYQKSLV